MVSAPRRARVRAGTVPLPLPERRHLPEPKGKALKSGSAPKNSGVLGNLRAESRSEPLARSRLCEFRMCKMKNTLLSCVQYESQKRRQLVTQLMLDGSPTMCRCNRRSKSPLDLLRSFAHCSTPGSPHRNGVVGCNYWYQRVWG